MPRISSAVNLWMTTIGIDLRVSAPLRFEFDNLNRRDAEISLL
jgi:hypothetical protein